MQRLLALFCCNWQSPSQDIDRFDSGLLSPSVVDLVHHSNNTRGSSRSKSSLFAEANAQEEEDIIQNIFDVIGQGHGDPATEGMGKLLFDALQLIKQANVRMAIITNLLETKSYIKGSEQVLEDMAKLILTLEEKRRTELVALIHDLPPAVLGDNIAKEQSRVLIDLNLDVKESVKEDRMRILKRKKLVDTITEVFQQTLSVLSLTDRECVLLYIFSKQPGMWKLKTILQQLFTSRLVSASISSRQNLILRINNIEKGHDDDIN